MDFKEFNYENFSLIDNNNESMDVNFVGRNNFGNNLGASVSTIPKTLCDLLDFRDFDDCSLNLHLANSTIKKPMGRINDVLIVANRNYVPIDFIVLDIYCNPTCPIILGGPFLRMIGAIIDMKE